LLLVLAPWTRLWDHNLFASTRPWLAELFDSLFVRGAVTGVGLLTVAGGLRDLASLVLRDAPRAEADMPAEDRRDG
jgi:hypothetical protein